GALGGLGAFDDGIAAQAHRRPSPASRPARRRLAPLVGAPYGRARAVAGALPSRPHQPLPRFGNAREHRAGTDNRADQGVVVTPLARRPAPVRARAPPSAPGAAAPPRPGVAGPARTAPRGAASERP